MTELWRTVRDAPAEATTVLGESAAALGEDALGWLACPLRLRPVRCSGGVLRTPDGGADLDAVFLLRLFSLDAELRWAHDAAGLGRAVLISESAIALPGWTAHPTAVVTTIDNGYALWGTRFSAHPDVAGWCRSAERRTGPMDIPVQGPSPQADPGTGWPSEYLALSAREYASADEHGNARVVEERLLGIRTASPTTGATR